MNLSTKLLTPNQVSLLLGVKQHTLAVWRCTGRYNLPFIKAGRLVRYRLEDISTFLENQTRTSTGIAGVSA